MTQSERELYTAIFGAVYCQAIKNTTRKDKKQIHRAATAAHNALVDIEDLFELQEEYSNQHYLDTFKEFLAEEEDIHTGCVINDDEY